MMRPSRSPGRSQRGVVLVIALVLLAVIAVTSAMAMRLALFGGIVGQNLRAQSLAMQAAETGLRHCEGRVGVDPFTTPMLADAGGQADDREWQLEANWADRAIAVPAALVDGALDANQRPQCLIRMLSLDEYRRFAPPRPDTISGESRGIDAERFVFYRITSRGFSPDFRRGSNGQSTSGAEVWLQSMVRTIE